MLGDAVGPHRSRSIACIAIVIGANSCGQEVAVAGSMRATRLLLAVSFALLSGVAIMNCGGEDPNSTDSTDEELRRLPPATRTLSTVAITTIPGASKNAGRKARFVAAAFRPGQEPAPSLSN